MYAPPKFAENEPAVLREFIGRYPFAILLTADAAHGLQISHVPVLWPAGRRRVLRLHLAAANPQARRLLDATADDTPATVIFSGPHGYVSPTWYENRPAVPTWNYAAVHVEGRVSRLTDEAERAATLRDLTSRFEGTGEGAFAFDGLPEDYRAGQMKGIEAFEIAIDSVQGKFKLSQNRPREDRESVVRHLDRSDRPDDRALAAFMRSRPGIVGTGS